MCISMCTNHKLFDIKEADNKQYSWWEGGEKDGCYKKGEKDGHRNNSNILKH